MGDNASDPIDHARTTRQHAGESMKNGANAPGLVLLALAIIAFVFALFTLASGHQATGWVAAAVALIAAVAGAGWLAYTHHQVRLTERARAAKNTQIVPLPPTS